VLRKPGLFIVSFVLLVCVACQANATVTMKVAESGSGAVSVAATLDKEAVDRLGGDIRAAVNTQDLASAGWKLSEPTTQGGLTTLTATKNFSSPAALTGVLEEVAGADGPLAGWKLNVSHEFASSQYQLSGTVKLSGSLDQFSDSAVAAALDGAATGRTPEELAAALKESPDSLQLRVVVGMPGSVDSAEGLRIDAKNDEIAAGTYVLGSGTPTTERVAVVASTQRKLGAALVIGGIVGVVLAVLLLLRSRRRGASRSPARVGVR
jgi:hypothetical protein